MDIVFYTSFKDFVMVKDLGKILILHNGDNFWNELLKESQLISLFSLSPILCSRMNKS